MYIIAEPLETMTGLKVHFASSKEVADEVVADLIEKYSSVEATFDDRASCVWDPGGMMMDDDVLTFNLADNFAIECRAQHFDYLVEDLEASSVKDKYIKLYGQYICICLSPEEFQKLKELVSNPAFALRASDSVRRRQEKLKVLYDTNCVIPAMEDPETGQVYEVLLDKEDDPALKYLN